jgi:dihydrolipoamide dehydrogenase
VVADRLLLAVGRSPQLAGLGLPALGLDEHALSKGLRGDDRGQVQDGLWAAGDVTGIAPFTHTATYQARIVAANLLGGSRRMNLAAVPRAVYTDPGVLSVGRQPDPDDDPDDDQDDLAPLLVAGTDLADTARGFLEGTRLGRVEVYATRSGTVVGAAAVSPAADDLLGQAILAVRAGIDVRLWEDVIQPFPAFSEVLGPALRDLVGELRGGEQTTGEQATGELSRRLPAAVTAAGASQAS